MFGTISQVVMLALALSVSANPVERASEEHHIEVRLEL
jgi:hypothetical protein